MSGVNKPNSDAKPDQQEKRKKESILELTKFLEKSIRVKFAGGREASGVLKGIFNWIKLKWQGRRKVWNSGGASSTGWG